MDQQQQRQALGTPELRKFKALGKGLEIQEVCGNRVLVRAVEPWTEMDETEAKGLLVVPDYIKKEKRPLPTTGVVAQVGPAVTKPQVGDMVMFSKFSGQDFMIEAEGFRIMGVDEIIAIIRFAGPVEEVLDDTRDLRGFSPAV